MNYRYHKDGLLPTNGEVLVFGSNTAGRHGAGLALVAAKQFGAFYGTGMGYMRGETPGAHCYAIPTKGLHLQTLSLYDIRRAIGHFKYDITYTELKDLVFFVSRVGCGLAGYRDMDIAPLFQGSPPNCIFPEEWRPWLG